LILVKITLTDLKLKKDLQVPSFGTHLKYLCFVFWGINASTENAENFNVIVEGNDWNYYS